MEIGAVLRVIDFLRQETQNVTMLQAGMLLAVMDRPGITQPALGKFFRTTQATVSRNVHKLAKATVQDPETGTYVDAGLDFIVLKTDAEDPRAIACHLSPKGEHLRDRILRLR